MRTKKRTREKIKDGRSKETEAKRDLWLERVKNERGSLEDLLTSG